jgi:hypothetical protein
MIRNLNTSIPPIPEFWISHPYVKMDMIGIDPNAAPVGEGAADEPPDLVRSPSLG